jgi:hypothetical protein
LITRLHYCSDLLGAAKRVERVGGDAGTVLGPGVIGSSVDRPDLRESRRRT